MYPFNTIVGSLTPLYTKDGKPYAPQRYKEIIKECYIISKNCNIPYSDVLNMSVIERNYMLEFLNDEAKQMIEETEKYKEQLKQQNNR